MLDLVHLQPDTLDIIMWNLTSNGIYFDAYDYLAQFEVANTTHTKPVVWDNWALPKCKLFAWPVIKNRIWTADRLERRGWPNCGLCQLCRKEPESTTHLLLKCRYSICVWEAVKTWLGATELCIGQWGGLPLVHACWNATVLSHGHMRRAIATTLMLVTWHCGMRGMLGVLRNNLPCRRSLSRMLGLRPSFG